MKKIDIIIATRNRYEKLCETLKSIPDLSYINIKVICDGDPETYQKLFQSIDIPIKFLDLTNKQVGSVACRNMLCCNCNDGVLYATDDIIFEKESIEAAFNCFNEHFLDDDGVVGFFQNNSFHPTGVALVGQKFLQRYPSKRLFFPGYFHFACQEILDLCQVLDNKFVQCEDARLFHYHPDFFKSKMDQTHKDARIHKSEDMKLIKARKERGIIWGLNG